MKIILTSCGIINDELKKQFYNLINKEASDIKVLYITTASDGEFSKNKAWMDREHQTILDLGIIEENIIEYKIGKDELDMCSYDLIYMMGGNTFYLLDMIRKHNFSHSIKQAINNNIVYVGSSAGSIILGNSIEVALPYDENKVGMTNFTGLGIIDGIIIPHANKKEEFIRVTKTKIKEKLYLLYDGDGIVINN